MCDREADIYEMFVLAEEKQAPLVIRASANRLLAEKEVGQLWTKVQQQPLADQLTLHITPNQQRPARQAIVSVRFCPVTLKPPWRPNQKKLPAITLNTILVREENPPQRSRSRLNGYCRPIPLFRILRRPSAWSVGMPAVGKLSFTTKSSNPVVPSRITAWKRRTACTITLR